MSTEDTTVAELVVFVDVTDTLRSRWRAGIQRVVCRLVQHLSAMPTIDLVPVVWSVELASFRQLLPTEREQLWRESAPPRQRERRPRPAEPTAGRRTAAPIRAILERAVSTSNRLVVALLERTRTKELVRELARRVALVTVNRHLRPFAVDHMPPGSVFFDIDAVWNVVQVDRDELYRDLRSRGVHVAALIYDLIPQEHPEWFEPQMIEVSRRAVAAQARHAELLLAISCHTAGSLVALVGAGGDELEVVTLGAELVPAGSATPLPEDLDGSRFVLVVGTIEPRKNHRIVLDAVARMIEEIPDVRLVVVGRPGWNDDEVVDRLLGLSGSDSYVEWITDASDSQLATLYERATVVATPSITEGYGLPVIEALHHGAPVVSSDGGALPEAGGDLVELVDPHDLDGWVEALTRHFADPEYHGAARAAISEYRAPTWNETARQVEALLLDRFAAPIGRVAGQAGDARSRRGTA